MNDSKPFYCECGQKAEIFVVKGSTFPKEWECPICQKVWPLNPEDEWRLKNERTI